MKLWVLEYTIGSVSIFLSPSGHVCNDIKLALKFNSFESASDYMAGQNLLIKFTPSEHIFDFNEK